MRTSPTQADDLFHLYQGDCNAKHVPEKNNAGPMPLAVHPGITICQIILEECVGGAHYDGRLQSSQLP